MVKFKAFNMQSYLDSHINFFFQNFLKNMKIDVQDTADLIFFSTTVFCRIFYNLTWS